VTMTTKLFVANLGWSVTENDLFNMFSDCGEVLTVKIPVRREDGRSRGFAFIEMAQPEHATRAIQQLNNMMLYNRPISVVLQDENYAAKRQQSSASAPYASAGMGVSYSGAPAVPAGPSNKLFIRNVNGMVNEPELARLFEQAGEVTAVKIPMDRETGMARGFAFIEMATVEAAETAMNQLNGAMVYGQEISITFQDPTRARSPRPNYAGQPYGSSPNNMMPNNMMNDQPQYPMGHNMQYDNAMMPQDHEMNLNLY
jgi:nucleolin